MGRKNRLPTTYDLFIIGEQLRTQMTSAGLIKDHRHHLRKHRHSFVAKDAIDWLVKMCHVDTRQDAVAAMTVLHEFSVIHHVSDDQEFKDKNAYFRFTRDDDTYKADRELRTFYRGLEISDKLKRDGKDVMREFYHKGELHKNAFYGSDLVDFLVESESAVDRETVVGELQDLLARDVIKHLTDDYHFSDDRLIYEFSIRFDKSCLLYNVLEIMESFNSFKVGKAGGSASCMLPSVQDTDDIAEDDLETSEISGTSNVHQTDSNNHSKLTTSIDPPSQCVLRLQCDNVGYGLILRGYAPCYVHAVDPLGPASKAKVKVGQAVSSINGQPVGHNGHKQVGLMMAQCEGEGQVLQLGVSTTHRRHISHS